MIGKKLSLSKLVGATLVVGAMVSLADTAMAQVTPSSQESLLAESRANYQRTPNVRPLPTLPEAYNRAYYRHDGNFFDNRGIWQGLRLIFGVPNYVENSISQDGRSVDRLYKETLEQQVSSDPILRTPDLPNPYTGSILTTPLVISEDPIRPIPPFPSFRGPSYAPAVPDAPAAPERNQPERPVPGLW